jgi:hypothetical protein
MFLAECFVTRDLKLPKRTQTSQEPHAVSAEIELKMVGAPDSEKQVPDQNQHLHNQKRSPTEPNGMRITHKEQVGKPHYQH